PLSLAQGISRVPSGAPINRAAAWSFVVLRHVWRHLHIPTLGNESPCVKSLVSAHRHQLRARQLLQHHQRRIPFCPPIGLKHFCRHDQPVAGSPPTDSRCNSTSTPCPVLCAPTAPPDQSSTHASRSIAARPESPPSGCRDHPAECPLSPLSLENSSLPPRLPAASRLP